MNFFSRLPRFSRTTPVLRRKRAFTFIELLVVIGIVFLLASLLLAVGAAMRKNARRQACLVEFEHAKNAQAIYFSKRGALVPSTECNGPVVGGHACYGTVRIYPTLADADANTNCPCILYDPLNATEIATAGSTGKLVQSNIRKKIK